MEEKFELLENVHKDAVMAKNNIKKLMEELKDKDNKIKSYLEQILKEYENYAEESKEILEKDNIKIENPSMIAKKASEIGIGKEVKKDNSDSAIAQMMIEGISMGSLEIEKKLKQYEKDIEKEHKKIARDFLKFQEKTIEHLKDYL